MHFIKNKLFLPLLVFSLVLVSLLYWHGIATPAWADTCESQGGVCASRTDCDDPESGGSEIQGTTGCTSTQICCDYTNGDGDGGGDGNGTDGGGGGAPGLGIINIKVPPLGDIARNLYLLALFGAALFFFFQVVIGGISWIGAGGDPKALDSARSRITNAVIGLVIVVAAFAITVIVLSALGINIFTGGEIDIFKDTTPST